jgi:hypothetical protein
MMALLKSSTSTLALRFAWQFHTNSEYAHGASSHTR